MTITERAIGSHDLVVWATDDASGLQAAIAVHTAEPATALAAVTMGAFPDPTVAMVEAMRRAEAGGEAAAALGVPVAGASVVVLGGDDRPGRVRVFRALGHVLQRLERELWVMPGACTAPGDLALVAESWPLVAGACPSNHHLPPEARGAVAAARAARVHRGERGLARARVLVLGADRLGAGVALMLAAQNAHVLVSDPDPHLAAMLADEVDGEVIPHGDALTTECDVLMPCRSGLALTVADVEGLRCTVLAGPADRQLAQPEVSPTLAARGITWVPEAISAAGAVMAAAREMGLPGVRHDVDADTARIVAITEQVLATADELRVDPSVVVRRAAALPGVPDPDGRVSTIRAA